TTVDTAPAGPLANAHGRRPGNPAPHRGAPDPPTTAPETPRVPDAASTRDPSRIPARTRRPRTRKAADDNPIPDRPPAGPAEPRRPARTATRHRRGGPARAHRSTIPLNHPR